MATKSKDTPFRITKADLTGKPPEITIKKTLGGTLMSDELIKEDLKKTKPVSTKGIDKRLIEAFADFKTGARRASEIAGELGLSRSKVRKTFATLAGGKAGYQAIMSKFAPVIPPKGQPRAPRRPGEKAAPVVPAVDDSKVPKLKQNAKERLKFRGERRLDGSKHRYDVLIAPDGTEYVQAPSNGKADLIFTFDTPGLSPMRMRILSKAKTKAEAKRTKEAHTVRTARKAAKRAKRKGAFKA